MECYEDKTAESAVDFYLQLHSWSLKKYPALKHSSYKEQKKFKFCAAVTLYPPLFCQLQLKDQQALSTFTGR